MKLVHEDEYGAYLGVTDEFLRSFHVVENDPNFDVFDSSDEAQRCIFVKSSRIPYDDDPDNGLFGFDFNRGKPTLEEALDYHAHVADSHAFTTKLAFSAASEEEYLQKAAVWDRLFSFVFSERPGNVWLSPHSGGISSRISKEIIIPESMIDGGTAGVSAMCAWYAGSTEKRNLIAVHTTGFMEAVLNLGDFGVFDEESLLSIVPDIEARYGDRIQYLAGRFFADFIDQSMISLRDILQRNGTLYPGSFPESDLIDRISLRFYSQCLAFYGLEVYEYTIDEFIDLFERLRRKRVRAVSCNGIFPGRAAGEMLGLEDKIKNGLLDSALQVECARIYMMNDPELVSVILLDVTRKLFS